MERLKVLFMFITDDADPVVNRSIVFTPSVEFNTIGVPNYEAAAKVAEEVAEQGFILIELCAGFDEEGTKMVIEGSGGKVKVGACSLVHIPQD